MDHTRVMMTVTADILDPPKLKAYATMRMAKVRHEPDPMMELGDYLVEALLKASPIPDACSLGLHYTMIETQRVPVEPPRGKCPIIPFESICLIVAAHIYDEEMLRTYAARRYRICWNDDLSFHGNIEQAFYEALIGSSEGPPTVDFGVSLRRYSYQRQT